MKKKLIALLVAVALTIGAIPAYAFATEGDEAVNAEAPTTEMDTAAAEIPAVDAADSDILAWWEALTQEQKLDFVPNLPEDNFEDWMYRLGELGLKDSHPAIDGPIEEFRSWWDRLSIDKQLSIAGLMAEDEDPQAWDDLVNTLIGEPVTNLEERVAPTAWNPSLSWEASWNGVYSRQQYAPILDGREIHVWLCADYNGPPTMAANANGGPGAPFTFWSSAVMKGWEYTRSNPKRADTIVIHLVEGNYQYMPMGSAFNVGPYETWRSQTGLLSPFSHGDGGSRSYYGEFWSENLVIEGDGMSVVALTDKANGNNDDWLRANEGQTITLRNLTLRGVKQDGAQLNDTEGVGSLVRVMKKSKLVMENVTIEGFQNENLGYQYSSPIIVEDGTVEMTDCIIRNNWFKGPGNQEYRAGAISVQSGSVSLTRTVIEGNTGAGRAGAIFMGPNSGMLDLDDCVITNNTSRGNGTNPDSGAAVWLENTGMQLYRGAYIYDNHWYNNAWQQRNVVMKFQSNKDAGKYISAETQLNNINVGGQSRRSKIGVDIKTDNSHARWGNTPGQRVAYAKDLATANNIVANDILVSDRNTEYQYPTNEQTQAFLYATQGSGSANTEIFWGEHEYEYYVSGTHANKMTDINDKRAGQRNYPFADLRSALQAIQVRTSDSKQEVVIKVLDNAPYAQSGADGWNAGGSFTRPQEYPLLQITIRRDDSVSGEKTIRVTNTNQKLFENISVPLVIENLTFDGNNSSTATLFKGTQSLTLNNVTVQNFRPAGHQVYFIDTKTSGANSQSITVNNCNFRNNQFGFALFHGNAQIIMTGGSITGNTTKADNGGASLINVEGDNAKLTFDNVTVQDNGATPANPLIWVQGGVGATLELKNGTKVINNNRTTGATAAAIQADNTSTVNLSGNITVTGNQRGTEEKNLELKGENILQLTGNVTGSVGIYDAFTTGRPGFKVKFGSSNGWTAQNTDTTAVFYTDIQGKKVDYSAQVVGNDLLWMTVFEYYVGAQPATVTGKLGSRTNPYQSLYEALDNIKNDEANSTVNIYVMDNTRPYFSTGQTLGWSAGNDANTSRVSRINIQPDPRAAAGTTFSISVGEGSGYLFTGWAKPLSIRAVDFIGSGNGVETPGFYQGATGGRLDMSNLKISNIYTHSSLVQGDGAAVSLADITITDNTYLDAQTPMIDITNGSHVTLTSTTIRSNNSAVLTDKGMIQIDNGGGTLTLQNTTITDNTVGIKGAIYTAVAGDSAQPIIFDVVHDLLPIKWVKGSIVRNYYKTTENNQEKQQERNVNIGDPNNKLIRVSGNLDFYFNVGISYDYVNGKVRPDLDLKDKEFGIATAGQRYVGFYYRDVAATKATARVKNNTTLYWDRPDVRYVAELVRQTGELMEDNGVPMRYTTVSEALSHVGNTPDSISGEMPYIVKLIDQTQYNGTDIITNTNDLAIREAYIDFRDVGDLTETGGFVYLDLNGQVLVSQGLIIPANIKLTGLDSSGKLKQQGGYEPQGELRVSNAQAGVRADKHAGIYTMADGQDPTKNDKGRVQFTAETSSGLDLDLENFYPLYVQQCLPVMKSVQHTLAPSNPTLTNYKYGVSFPTINDVATEKYDKLIGAIINDAYGVNEPMVMTVYKFARFRLEPVKHRIVMDQEMDTVTLGTLMMFQTNSRELLDIRWSFGETITAPDGSSKSTYQYTPAQNYGAQDSLGWTGPHFTYYVETTFKGGADNKVLKDALAFGNTYELTNNLHFPVAGCRTAGLTSTTIGNRLSTLVQSSDNFNRITTELLPQALKGNGQAGNSNVLPTREYGQHYVGLYGNSRVTEHLGYAATPDMFSYNTWTGTYTLKTSQINRSGDSLGAVGWKNSASDFAKAIVNHTDKLVGAYYTMSTYDQKNLRTILEGLYKTASEKEKTNMQVFLEKMQLTIRNGGITEMG